MASRGTGAQSSDAGAGAAPARGPTRFERAIQIIALVGFVIGGATGFGPKYLLGRVEGWLLFAHTLGAPLFIVGLAGNGLIWAERCRFALNSSRAAGGLNTGQKLLFWIGLVLGFVTVLSMLAAMLPVFGYAGQELLIEIHGISALLLVIAMIILAFVSLAARRSKR
ncbi:MAG: hypothetical protein ACE5I3_15830 [Phycisphaerae bacterium]